MVELKTSKLLSSISFEKDLYSYTFSSNSENELNNILNIVDEENIVSYFFEKH